MEQPPGYETERQDKDCRIKKNIYGLKQAARYWNQWITDILKITN